MNNYHYNIIHINNLNFSLGGQVGMKSVPKIILSIYAHGRETTYYVGKSYGKYAFALPTNHIKIMNCGGGSSGSLTITNDKYIQNLDMEIKQNVSLPDHFIKTKKALMYKYKKRMKNIRLTIFGEYMLKDSLWKLKDIDCFKLYKPINNRMYSYQDSIFHTFISVLYFKHPTDEELSNFDQNDNIDTIINVLRVENYNETSLVNSNLMKIEKLMHNKKYAKIVKTFTEDKEIQLSDIIFICNLLNFKCVEIYELSCRSIDQNKIDYKSLKILNANETINI